MTYGEALASIVASPGGLALLERLLVDHGIPQSELDKITDTLPDPPTEPKK